MDPEGCFNPVTQRPNGAAALARFAAERRNLLILKARIAAAGPPVTPAQSPLVATTGGGGGATSLSRRGNQKSRVIDSFRVRGSPWVR